MKTITKAQVLAIAAHREFFVPKYSWSAEKLRKMTRRMLHDGELTKIRSDSTGFYYRAAK